MHGLIPPGPGDAVVFPVVAGTGAFLGGRGTVTVTSRGHPSLATNVYRLTYRLTA